VSVETSPLTPISWTGSSWLMTVHQRPKAQLMCGKQVEATSVHSTQGHGVAIQDVYKYFLGVAAIP
jgi:hypothetical protein